MKPYTELITDPPPCPKRTDDLPMLASAAVLKEQRDVLLAASKRVCNALNNANGMSGQAWIKERKAAFESLREAVREVEGS